MSGAIVCHSARCVYETSVRDINELRQRLLHVWRGLEQSLIDDAVDQMVNALACKLVFVPVADIFNKLCDYQFVFSVLDELHVLHHA